VTDTYTQLLEWRRNEIASRGLGKLPLDFYRTTEVYLAETRRTYETELRSNPSSRKGELARQTYQRASHVARDLIDARTTKLVGAALQAALGGSTELPNGLPEERSLFESLRNQLLQHRRSAAPYLLREEPSSDPTPATVPAEESPPPKPSSQLTYVRVLQGGRSIEMGPETIDLRAHEVLSLPPDRAQMLVQAKMAVVVADPGAHRVT
jgi:DNA replication initiation complex subunit (GINS family)